MYIWMDAQTYLDTSYKMHLINSIKKKKGKMKVQSALKMNLFFDAQSKTQ